MYPNGEVKTLKVEAEGKPTGAQTLWVEARRIQVRGVIRVRPETGRSRRGQVEAWRKLRGGPKRY